MEVSRQTFQNILEGARKKVAEALVKGLPLQIKGGDFAFQSCQFQCSLCKATYKINFIRDKSNCPLCKSDQIVCLNRRLSAVDIVKDSINPYVLAKIR